MRKALSASPVLVLVLVLAAAERCRADDQEPRVAVLLENLDGRAHFRATGVASFLPDGTQLTITLQVRDHHPVIEAGVYRAAVVNGKYGGSWEWPKKAFAPLSYRTVVKLHMDQQSGVVKKFLSQQLGYAHDHVETISATDTEIGTQDERAAFQVQTLLTLRDYLERVTSLHQQLQGVVQVPVAQNAEQFGPFKAPFIADLKRVLDELKALEDTRVVWYDIGMFRSLNQAVRQLSRALRKYESSDPMVMAELNNTANDLRVVRDELGSRLPAEPGEEPAPATTEGVPAPGGG